MLVVLNIQMFVARCWYYAENFLRSIPRRQMLCREQ